MQTDVDNEHKDVQVGTSSGSSCALYLLVAVALGDKEQRFLKPPPPGNIEYGPCGAKQPLCWKYSAVKRSSEVHILQVQEEEWVRVPPHQQADEAVPS